MTVKLPINYLDTGKVARDKINNSFNEMVETVQGYRPHIEDGIWYIGDTNTGVKAYGDSISMKVEDGYIRYKSESQVNWTQIIAIEDLKGDKGDQGDPFTYDDFTEEQLEALTGPAGASINSASFSGNDIVFGKDNGDSVTLSNAKTTLTGPQGTPGDDGASVVSADLSNGDMVFTKDDGNTITIQGAVATLTGPQGDPGPQGEPGDTGNGIESITSSKEGGVTTVTITETNGDTESFDVSDGEMTGPDSSVDGDIALFDGTTGKLIKDGNKKLTDLQDKLYPGVDIDIEYDSTGHKDVSGTNSIVLDGAIDDSLNSVTIYGKCVQNGTPTTSDPVSIICNNGELKYRASIADFSDGLIKRSNNTVVSLTSTKDSITYTFAGNYGAYAGKVFSVTEGQTYTINWDTLTEIAKIYFVELNSNITKIDNNYGTAITEPYTFTATKSYIGIWLAYSNIPQGETTIEVTGLTLAEGSEPAGVYADGTAETITDSLNNTATAEMLLGMGNYIDSQEILTGLITRKIGVQVFDGTENWSFINTNYSDGTHRIYWNGINANTDIALCNYFSLEPLENRDNQTGGNDKFYYSVSSIHLRSTEFTNLSTAKAWLAQKYASGNPVMFVYVIRGGYPTESVTAQELTTQEGTNILTAQGSLSDLSLSANYDILGNIIRFNNEEGYIKQADMPNIVDNLTSTSATDALSANQGRILDGKIADLMALGKFLSLWNSATGQPISFPYTTPYTYHTGDYYMVETIDNTTNYRPNGSSYTGTASSTSETDEVAVGDFYVYDGSIWLLASNHGKTVSFGNIAGQPSDNTNLANALNAKQNNWIDVEVTTAYNTAAKVGTTTAGNYTPTKGDFLLVEFTRGSSVANPTLNIDGSGAKNIRSGNANVNTSNFNIGTSGNTKILMYYDGDYYKVWSTANTTYGLMGVAEGQAGTAVSSRVVRADYLKQIIDYHAGNLDNQIKVIGGEGISVKYNDYSAMRGPCPEGYHIPTRAECDGLRTILTSLGITTGSGIIVALKMPLAGYIDYNRPACDITYSGTYGRYWTVDEVPTAGVYDRSYNLAINVRTGDDSYATGSYGRKSGGNSIRAFKDEYIEPDNTWTVISGTLGSAGVFYNATLGLITITSGTAGYTIMDKNIGATTVYNNGDTLSEANCGRYFQRGNNYGFRGIGNAETVPTSNTQVDTTGYGPRHPYSSSTYILGYDDWSSVQNTDIWGGVTGVANTVNCNAVDNTSNTKTFYLSSTSDLTTAQAAYDWWKAGKNPIICYNNDAYLLSSFDRDTPYSELIFISPYNNYSNVNNQGYTHLSSKAVIFRYGSDTVSVIYITNVAYDGGTLRTDVNYTTPYTPQYNGSPATKKYVDDSVSVVSGDSGTTYTIKVSNSAPTSGTPNTTITFVTGS